MRRYAYWRYRLLRLQSRGFHASQAAPAGALGVGGLAVLAGALGVVPVAVLAIPAGIYAALIVLASLRASLSRGFRYLPLLPAAYLAIHAGVAAGFWSGLLAEGWRRARGGVPRERRAMESAPRE
jgi:hypothetical protein